MPNILDPNIDFAEYMQLLGKQESQSIRSPCDFYDKIKDRRDGTGGMHGEALPWDSGHFFEFRPGEVTGWIGYNFHGKSRIAGMVATWLMPKSRHLVASLEMPAAATIDRMVSQSAGSENYSDSYMTNWLDWADNRLWLYDVQERTDAERLLGLVYYARNELQCDHVWIDSLMQTKVSGDDRARYGKQAEFIDELCRAAKTTGVHVHIIMHLRKPEGFQGEEKIPDRYSARGAAELVDRPDNVIIIHSNVAKTRKAAEQDPPDDLESWRDGTFVVDKQRHCRGKRGTGRIPMYESPGGAWNDSKARIQFPVDVFKVRTVQSVERYHERKA